MSFDTIPAKSLEKYSDPFRYVTVDVRSRKEFLQGHVPGAVNVPYEALKASLDGFDRAKTYILYCDRGAVSLLAARKMFREGYNVLSVIGGLAAYRGPLTRM